MRKLLFVLLLIAAPLAAERESNFGRVILDNCDVIVQGVASATRTQVGAAERVEVSIETVLYGEEKQTDISVYYSDHKELGAGAVRALFALDRLSDGGYNLVGKPVATPHDDPEGDSKLLVCRAFIQLEKEEAGAKRVEAFWTMLSDHILMGGYAAQNAAVELMFVARDRGSIITLARFDMMVSVRDNALNRLTKETQADLILAFQGLVEAKVKNLKFKSIRRGEDNKEKREAARDLNDLQSKYPRAFSEDDAKLCDALLEISKDAVLDDKLKELSRNIRADVQEREREDRRKEADARRKIDHAGK